MAMSIPSVSRPINHIIVHTTATRSEWWKTRTLNQKVAEVRKWHVQDRGWSDIGYHYLIDRDGKIAEGRPLSRVGAHVRGHNTGSIGIALFGGFGGAEDDKFSDHYTPAQDKALRSLISAIQGKYNITRISGHHEFAAKACPCFRVRPWLEGAAPTSPRAPVSVPAKSPARFSLLAFLLKLFGGRK